MKWRWHGEQDKREIEHKEVLRVTSKLLIPPIMLFGLFLITASVPITHQAGRHAYLPEITQV